MKNPPASAGNVGDMGWIPVLEDPLEEKMATLSSILALKSRGQRSLAGSTVHGIIVTHD